jgi:uncharacterized protein YbjT (DUF2867 family)
MFFIAGGTGFVGSHLVRALADSGMRARCLARSAGKLDVCRKAGLDAAIGDITDRESLAGKLEGCHTVVHLVGIIEEKGDITFEKIHVQGTENLVAEAKRAKVKHFFYQSALGASLSSRSRYQKTKAQAEEMVKDSGIPYIIFRPSLIVGEGDGFTRKLIELLSFGPVVPVPGEGKAKLQPIYIEDLIKCFMACQGEDKGEVVYELGGPEHLTYNEILSQLQEVMGTNKPVIHVPIEVVKLSLPLSRVFQGLGNMLGKSFPSVTAEQLQLLQTDNICDVDGVKKHFGFEPLRYRDVLRLFVKQVKG